MSLWDLSYPTAAEERPPRAPPPASAPQSRRAYGPSSSRFSLESWEQLCPLNDHEKQSVVGIQSAAFERPLPRHLALKSVPNGRNGAARPTSPSGHPLLRKAHASRMDLTQSAASSHAGSSRPPSPSSIAASGDECDIDPIELTSPVATVQAFNDWFAAVAKLMDSKSESRYRAHFSRISSHLATCDDILSQLDDCRGFIREIEANWRFVDENAQSMERACEGMLDEQKHLDALASSLTERLGYFRRLEEAQRFLSMPGEAELVQREEFLGMLSQLDVCLEFMKSNHNFRDADLYLVRFQQCLTRAMTLIKLYFVTTVSACGNDAFEKLNGRDVSETASSALLYTKFLTLAQNLRPLLSELEKRALFDAQEYEALLSECFTTWFATRGGLLNVRVAQEVARMDPAGRSTDLVGLVRSGCNYLRGVCSQEWHLFRQFFLSLGEEDIGAYMEKLCDHLYDLLRPRILHEQRLEVLCDLCTVVHALMALDSEPPMRAMIKNPAIPTSRLQQSNLARVQFHFGPLLRPILQDVQTRLVFRAQAIIQSDVLYYNPQPSDLDYPSNLQKRDKRNSGLWELPQDIADSEDGEALRFRLPPGIGAASVVPDFTANFMGAFKVHTYVNNAIFEDLAGEAVGFCRQSLVTASTLIAKRDDTTPSDGQLFAIRHLLVLKEMIRTVDLVQIDRAVDLTPMTDALSNLLRNSSAIFNPNVFFQLAARGFPNFAETMKDAKLDLDGQLKQMCEEFISTSAKTVSVELQRYLDKCTAFLSDPTTKEGSKDLPSQSWATSEVVLKLHNDYSAQVASTTRNLRDQMRLYLEEEKTVAVLLSPLKDEITECYTTFYNLVRSEYSFATGSTMATPTSIRALLFPTQKSLDMAL